MRYLGLPLLAAAFVACTPMAFAQTAVHRNLPADPYPPGPSLLFRETWQQPPGTPGGPFDDVATRLTPTNLPLVLTNKGLELHVYGTEAEFIRTAKHYGRQDLWTGLAHSAVAVTLKDKANYLDLTGLARLRWMLRTNSVFTWYPVLKLADGTFIISRRAIVTDGQFILVDIAFGDMTWFKLDPQKVVPLVEVKNPDLSKVDEIGMAALQPSGGHGIAASGNLSNVEVYAKPVPR